MKVNLIILCLLLILGGCKNDHEIHPNFSETNTTESLQADFNKQTGYKETDKYFLMSNFKTQVNWNKIIKKHNDTLYFKVEVLDTVKLLVGSRLVNIHNRVWIKGVRGADSKINYSLLIFAPADQRSKFNGLIITKSLRTHKIKESYFLNSAKISRLGYLSTLGDQQNIPSSLKKASQNAKKSGSGCVTGYVNGQPNTTKCPPSDIDFGEDPGDDGGFGDTGGPQDYYDTHTPSDSGQSETPPKTAEDFNEEIDDSNLPDCMKQVLAELKNLNGNTVADIIKKFAGEVPGYNWKVTFSDKTMDLTQFAGTDLVYLTDKGQVTTVLNSDPIVFKYTSDLSLAKTLIHESIHAYLTTLYYTDRQVILESYPEMLSKFLKQHKKPENDVQHDILVKYFISDIAKTLKSYGTEVGYRLTDQFYSDLAWGGLLNTRAFSQLPEQDRLRIKGTVNSEQYGNNVSTNGQTQKGKKMDCNN